MYIYYSLSMDLKVKIMLNWAGPLGCMDMAVSPLHSHASVTLLECQQKPNPAWPMFDEIFL
jgi:hypothetical protein